MLFTNISQQNLEQKREISGKCRDVHQGKECEMRTCAVQNADVCRELDPTTVAEQTPEYLHHWNVQRMEREWLSWYVITSHWYYSKRHASVYHGRDGNSMKHQKADTVTTLTGRRLSVAATRNSCTQSMCHHKRIRRWLVSCYLNYDSTITTSLSNVTT